MNNNTSTNSNDDDEATAAVAAATTVRLANTSSSSSKPKGVFPEVLFQLLNDAEEEGFDNIVSWMPDGSSFKVHDRKKFETRIMHRYFSSCKFRSFQKSLLLWGYRAISMSVSSPERGVLRHPAFSRDCTPEMLQSVRRRKISLPQGKDNESGNKRAIKGANKKMKKTSGNLLGDVGVLASKVAPHPFIHQPHVGQPLVVPTPPPPPSRAVASFPPTQNTIDSILRAGINFRNSSILAADLYSGRHSQTGDDLQRAALLASLLQQQRAPPPPQVVTNNELADVHSQGGYLQSATLLSSLLQQQQAPPPPQVVAHNELAGVRSQQGDDLQTRASALATSSRQQLPPLSLSLVLRELSGVHSQGGGDIKTTGDALLASTTLQQSYPGEYEELVSSLHRKLRQMEIRKEFLKRVGDEIAALNLVRTGTMIGLRR